jgi:hypothetical protein
MDRLAGAVWLAVEYLAAEPQGLAGFRCCSQASKTLRIF